MVRSYATIAAKSSADTFIFKLRELYLQETDTHTIVLLQLTQRENWHVYGMHLTYHLFCHVDM